MFSYYYWIHNISILEAFVVTLSMFCMEEQVVVMLLLYNYQNDMINLFYRCDKCVDYGFC